MNLLEISDEYKKTAQTFLSESNLLSTLEKYGRVEFEGAFAGNVMLHGDIDIKIVRDSDYTTDEIFSILRDIHDTCGDTVRSLFTKADWDDPRLGQQFPNGKYIGLKTHINEERWKIDIWFISEAETSKVRAEIDISKVSLTEEQKQSILEFKQYRKEHNLKISGQEIYEAVLKDNQANPQSFFESR